MSDTIGQLVARLSETNIKLWHEEDRARANDYADAQDAKRSIDQLNQQRNDLIEAIDELLTPSARAFMVATGITTGSVTDRMSREEAWPTLGLSELDADKAVTRSDG